MAKPFEVGISRPFSTRLSDYVRQGKETEHNWASRDSAIQRVRGMLKGEVHTRYTDTFYACLKEGFMQWSLKTVRLILPHVNN